MLENAVSHLDAGQSYSSPLLLRGTKLTKGQFGVDLFPVIYPSSLVMLNPRWTAERYGEYYTTEYDRHYRLDLKPDVGHSGIVRNMEVIVDRLDHSGFLRSRKQLDVLDAGSGPGYGIPVLFDRFDCRHVDAVESSPDSLEIIKREKYAHVIGADLAGSLSGTGRRYDLIIMRHIVEHLLSPVSEMSVISAALKQDGFVYIAVPDMLNPRTVLRDYDEWWIYWFRAVHAYYYNKYTLFKTLDLANLKVIEFGCESEEVWCLARRKKEGEPPYNYDYEAIYAEQSKVLARHLP